MVALRHLTTGVALLLTGVCGLGTAQNAALEDLGTAYATYLSAGRLRDDCAARDPALSTRHFLN
ncbi:hypothetical protein [Deinococcus aquatilis]|uniref:hypothetical protein n=1 Tax=Deinococcus aquatilis TaxID=519440 RepID=UPI00037D42C3|nr:hypothetical protein [Deinococcus aquatilis]